MTTPFQEALLAIQIAVDALHVARQWPDAAHTADDALAEIRQLGFETRPSGEAKPRGTFSERAKKPVQRRLF